jgi:hypothetical protein
MSDMPRTVIEHVKAMFDPDVLRRLRHDLDGMEAERRNRATTEREQAAIARGETSDALRLDPRWYDVWREPGDGSRTRVGPFRWVIYPPQVRIVRDGRTHMVPWHQDLAFQQVLGPRGHRRAITCFVPIDDDPAKHTTLQFCPDEAPLLPHRPVAGFAAGIEVPPRADRVHFDLALGDALVFGDLVVHRTFVPPGATVERRSLEFRLARPDDAIDDKDYFDLDAGCFVRRDGSRRFAP